MSIRLGNLRIGTPWTHLHENREDCTFIIATMGPASPSALFSRLVSDSSDTLGLFHVHSYSPTSWKEIIGCCGDSDWYSTGYPKQCGRSALQASSFMHHALVLSARLPLLRHQVKNDIISNPPPVGLRQYYGDSRYHVSGAEQTNRATAVCPFGFDQVRNKPVT